MPLSVVGLDPVCAFYVRQAALGGPVLVLGAAEGAVACAIAARGLEVVAVDPSSRMLKEAIARREAQARGSSLRFVNADLRTVRLDAKFKVVLAPQNALGLCPDQLAAVCVTMATHLDPSGVLALDVRAEPRFFEAPETEPLLVRRSWFAHLRSRDAEGRGRAIHRYRQRAYDPRELDEALASAGLEARERYADFQGAVFGLSATQQVVLGGPTAGPS